MERRILLHSEKNKNTLHCFLQQKSNLKMSDEYLLYFSVVILFFLLLKLGLQLDLLPATGTQIARTTAHFKNAIQEFQNAIL